MPLLKQAGLYWRTLRWLRPEQFYRRAWFLLHPPVPELQDPPPLRAVEGAWQGPARRLPSLTAPHRFDLLGVEGALDELGWDGPARDKLWRYNQHYFDDLNAVGADERVGWHRDLVELWVKSNAPATGVGWEPYPTSLRIVNWVKWALAGNELPPLARHSLAVQARWLARRLEWHLLGNHLFSNAKALVFAGCFFQGREADRWLQTGLGILAREIPEQILADGGHFERSTMYHALATEDMLDLCNLAATYGSVADGRMAANAAPWGRRVNGMLGWLAAMCHPDGEIAFFNDAALGIAPAPQELFAYAGRLALAFDRIASDASRYLRESGYVRLARGDAVAIIDVAPVGPDYLPGHAHADTLSLELSVSGQRVLVNSGIDRYTKDAERQRQRGTAAHNTVVVDDLDSSEVWSGFRVGRRARVTRAEIEVGTAGVDRVLATHDGYALLGGRPIHQRTVELDTHGVGIEDHVRPAPRSAVARFHFHPAARPSIESASSGSVHLGGGQRVHWQVERGRGRLEAATWHPRFGRSEPTQCLCVDLVQGSCSTRWTWATDD